ncbi:hypothetical protein I3843_05G140600 [Carya illinoinensis]|uniref:Transmembrane protein n=1 Tax=Carya illinoinensis TaxID=32201 RepID=A0A8T1QJQ8_CARIL|nr:uncharacterized protein LOC122310187 [Carya illinoinensis]KAG2707564.1 hypothetical protein I3760_05G152900 [Carya illinoinensis]KAG6654539.1 hypothetical protein CIPAW_05G151900 [Carya illinoinensis]KAG6713395.1 hypothetical protein I3842_05G149500 [Carya illinoinensis]KAG7979634.1 hypothetical protein I3843_05G140600 [Carya illinoinensis]
MSLQPQQQQQQPVLVYPANTVARQPPSHHSNGSFGTVFIVLAVIIAVSAIACCLGRLCNRRYINRRPKQNHGHSRPRENGDIEHARGGMKAGDHGGEPRESRTGVP